MDNKYANIAVIALLAILTLEVLSYSQKTSLLFDEPLYISSGITHWRTGDSRLINTGGVPPLPEIIMGIPSIFMNLNVPLDNPAWKNADPWAFGQYLVFEANKDPWAIIFFTRLPILILSILLGYLIYLFGSELFGRKAGLFALALYVFEPNIIAHSGVATVDICLSFFYFATIYFFYHFLRKNTLSNLVVTGIWLGLALATKFTSVFLVPVIFILCYLWAKHKKPIKLEKNRFGIGISSWWKAFGVIFIIAFVLSWGFYGFEFSPISKKTNYAPHVVEFFNTNPLGGRIKYFIENVPLPASTFARDFIRLLYYINSGSRAFLLGEYSETGGWWYYFYAAFALKVPIALLALLALAVFYSIRKMDLERWIILWPAIAVILAFSFLNNYNVGIRHILPAFPFLFVFIGGMFSDKFGLPKRVKIISVLLLALFIFSSVSSFPYYLGYFNEFAGGIGNGYKSLSSHNINYGALLMLKDYMHANGINNIKLAHESSTDPKYYGINYTPITSNLYPSPPCGKQTGKIAVTVEFVDGIFIDPPDCYDWLKDYAPKANVGGGFLVYDIPDK
jgi:hypothetical protein